LITSKKATITAAEKTPQSPVCPRIVEILVAKKNLEVWQ